MFLAESHLRALKRFQRDTVDHVIRRMFDDPETTRRFLVADETGLGKSLVARGVIAEAIERLQHDDAVARIDIVYVCSNSAIARQNLRRLDVLDRGQQHHATRLTLLAQSSGDLDGAPDPEVGKRVNLISFTPGTSFDLSWGGGRADERALLHRLLADDLGLTGTDRRAAMVLLQGRVGELATFRRIVDAVPERLDPGIVARFRGIIAKSGIRKDVRRWVDEIGRRQRLRPDERGAAGRLVGELRGALARAGVDALEPDLVILDEFQRFRHLLSTDDPNHREAAELAHALFDYPDARVLLLSATPYKAFTYAEEAAHGDDHAADLRRVLGFLGGTDDAGVVTAISDGLADFRRAAISGGDVDLVRAQLERDLTSLMCRTERPRLGDDGMLTELLNPAGPVESADVVDYGVIRSIAARVGAQMHVDYWKSTPYFLNFCDGYQLGERLREGLADPVQRRELRELARRARHLDRDAVGRLEEIDPANARLRQLQDETVGAGWWKLLWIPSSMPYQPPGGPFADVAAGDVSKRLIFSSWSATPTAIAALLSHEVRRRMIEDAERLDGHVRRLEWGLRPNGQLAARSTLLLFWPNPLALDVDPREVQRTGNLTRVDESAYWQTSSTGASPCPPGLDPSVAVDALTGRGDDEERSNDSSRRVRRYVDAMVERAVALDAAGAGVTDLDGTGAAVLAYAPGNVAYRCVHRMAGHEVSEIARWRAAAIIASGVRSLFNRPETTYLLDQLVPRRRYWHAVLTYCRWGNLEAVLDEYLHHLGGADLGAAMTDEKLIDIAEAVQRALTLTPAQYEAFDPVGGGRPIQLPSRFALRYGSRRATGPDTDRQPEILGAFNSPFWPFVLATTSVGQEGIDFHWWCHVTTHWNTPANPVDFEQREGRVSRFGGLVVRRNLAARHGDAVLATLSATQNPWRSLFELGMGDGEQRFGELAPHWIYDGPTKVVRQLYPYPLSRDHGRYERLKDDLVLYRLTFGQPRQEDLLELLRRRGVEADPDQLDALRIDLRPPRR